MIRSAVKKLLRYFGLELVRRSPRARYPHDYTPEDIASLESVAKYTMTGLELQHALIEAIRYIVRADVQGDIVECGVWRGGSMMLAARTLLMLKQSDRVLHLFDTFEGMPQPGDLDVSFGGQVAGNKFRALRRGQDASDWCYASLDDVRRNMTTTGYPEGRIRYIQGKVEDTIPGAAPESISILRLDTDWYSSTIHEMRHLYPRLVPGGVLILDDYGHWQGCHQAVEEYFSEVKVRPLLFRVNMHGRILIKT